MLLKKLNLRYNQLQLNPAFKQRKCYFDIREEYRVSDLKKVLR